MRLRRSLGLAPRLYFPDKTPRPSGQYAINVTSGEDPATVATPGDTIRYALRVENTTDTPLDGFSIVDELDSLTERWVADHLRKKKASKKQKRTRHS